MQFLGTSLASISRSFSYNLTLNPKQKCRSLEEPPCVISLLRRRFALSADLRLLRDMRREKESADDLPFRVRLSDIP